MCLGNAIPNAIKMVLAAFLADARNKRVVPGRYKKAGKYLLDICYCRSKSSTDSAYKLSVSSKASLSFYLGGGGVSGGWGSLIFLGLY